MMGKFIILLRSNLFTREAPKTDADLFLESGSSEDKSLTDHWGFGLDAESSQSSSMPDNTYGLGTGFNHFGLSQAASFNTTNPVAPPTSQTQVMKNSAFAPNTSFSKQAGGSNEPIFRGSGDEKSGNQSSQPIPARHETSQPPEFSRYNSGQTFGYGTSITGQKPLDSNAVKPNRTSSPNQNAQTQAQPSATGFGSILSKQAERSRQLSQQTSRMRSSRPLPEGQDKTQTSRDLGGQASTQNNTELSDIGEPLAPSSLTSQGKKASRLRPIRPSSANTDPYPSDNQNRQATSPELSQPQRAAPASAMSKQYSGDLDFVEDTKGSNTQTAPESDQNIQASADDQLAAIEARRSAYREKLRAALQKRKEREISKRSRSQAPVSAQTKTEDILTSQPQREKPSSSHAGPDVQYADDNDEKKDTEQKEALLSKKQEQSAAPQLEDNNRNLSLPISKDDEGFGQTTHTSTALSKPSKLPKAPYPVPPSKPENDFNVSPSQQGKTISFSWETDAQGILRKFSLSALKALHISSQSIIGLSLEEAGQRFGFDPDGTLAQYAKSGARFSNIKFEWPLDGNDSNAEIVFSGMPKIARDKSVLGVRGFGSLSLRKDDTVSSQEISREDENSDLDDATVHQETVDTQTKDFKAKRDGETADFDDEALAKTDEDIGKKAAGTKINAPQAEALSASEKLTLREIAKRLGAQVNEDASREAETQNTIDHQQETPASRSDVGQHKENAEKSSKGALETPDEQSNDDSVDGIAEDNAQTPALQPEGSFHTLPLKETDMQPTSQPVWRKSAFTQDLEDFDSDETNSDTELTDSMAVKGFKHDLSEMPSLFEFQPKKKCPKSSQQGAPLTEAQTGQPNIKLPDFTPLEGFSPDLEDEDDSGFQNQPFDEKTDSDAPSEKFENISSASLENAEAQGIKPVEVSPNSSTEEVAQPEDAEIQSAEQHTVSEGREHERAQKDTNVSKGNDGADITPEEPVLNQAPNLNLDKITNTATSSDDREQREDTDIVDTDTDLQNKETGSDSDNQQAEVEAPLSKDTQNYKAVQKASAASLAKQDLSALSILQRIPLGVIIFSGKGVVYGNHAALEITGFEDPEALRKIHHIEALFSEPVSKTDTCLPLKRADGSFVDVFAKLETVTWHDEPADMLTFRASIQQDTLSTQSIPEMSHVEAKPEVKPEIKEETIPDTNLTNKVSELESILDTATDGVLVLDQGGTILSMNKSAEALFGYNAEDMIDHSFKLLFTSDSQPVAFDYLEGVSKNGVASILNDGREVTGLVNKGGEIPLFMTVGRLSDGQDAKFCAVLRDITQWKRAEEDLLDAKKAAEKANSQKSDFLAKVSHEIRTPLNAIIGFSEVMMEERFGPVGSERYRGYLRDIHDSGEHLMSLLNDLLDLSKIEAGKLDLKFGAVDMNSLVQQCVSIMQVNANKQRIIIRTSLEDDMPQVVCDARSMRQVILNLLSNAIKFTKSGGQVIISTVYEKSGEVLLRVRDSGIGMSKKDIDLAMQPFRQIETTTNAGSGLGGTGLGLPLTKALAEANRASFAIESTPNEGTLVRITFPSQRVLAE
jgi:PAS domain S-box-containing protein